MLFVFMQQIPVLQRHNKFRLFVLAFPLS